MNKNVGPTERWIRIGAGSGLMLWAMGRRGWLRNSAMTLGASLIGTGIAQKCGINKMFEPAIFKKEPTLAKNKPLVDETSEESFPASDAPSWAAGRAN